MKIAILALLILLELAKSANTQNSNKALISDSTFNKIQNGANKYYVLSGDTIYVTPDKNPSYVGGDDKLMVFIKTNIIYPKEAREKQVEGTVVVSCIINSKGNITNCNILHGIGNGCNEEALRIIKCMPNWIPGYNNKKPVSVKYFIPVMFTLK